MPTVTTTRIVAEKWLQKTCAQQCVDWAIGMLEDGSESDHVTRLAGKLPPFNHFEIAALRDRALEELQVVEAPREEAVIAYASEVLLQGLDGEIPWEEVLPRVAKLHVDCDFLPALQRFYLLANAFSDLQSNEYQYYVREADRSNIVALVEHEARAFLGLG